MEVLIVLVAIYGLGSAAIAVFMWRDARQTNAQTSWTRSTWLTAILLGPVALLLIVLQRVLPDPRDERQ